MELITKYFPSLTDEQRIQFSKMKDVYDEWNSKINVISRKDMDSFYEKHVLHSLAIAEIISFKDQTRILDIGTGGGFPGIPLAVLFPKASFHLVDSIGKKIRVVSEVIASLDLKNVSAEKIRAEEVKDSYDFVCSRAVADYSVLLNIAKSKIRKNSFNDLNNGIICLKGGDLEAELAPYNKQTTTYNVRDFFSEDFFETKKIIYQPIP